MLLKTNIPETTSSLGGHLVNFGNRLSDQLILNDSANKLQVVPALGHGNRCGHTPKSPRFFNSPEHHKPRPHILQVAKDAFKKVYDKPKNFINKLVTAHENDRQVRSERREAVAAISQALIHYTDLETLKVGFCSNSNKFISLDHKYLAEKAGLSPLRARRAMADMAEGGYLDVTRQFVKQEDGNFIALPSIRKFTAQFFIDLLGMDLFSKLFFAREWKRKKREKKLAKESRNKLNQIIQVAASLGGQVKSGMSVIKRTTQKAITTISKDLIKQALELHRANPERTPSDYLKELQRLNV